MIRKCFFFLLLLLTFVCQVRAQVAGLFKDQASFTNDVKTMMELSKQEPSIAAGNNIQTVYSSTSDPVKKKLFEITQFLYQKRKFKSAQYIDFFSAVYAAATVKNVPASDLDSMLYVTQKILEKYDSKQMLTFFTTIRNFFEKDALFATSYNSLYVKGGSYRFRFVEAAPAFDPYDESLLEQKQDQALEDLDDGWEVDPGTLTSPPVEEEMTMEEETVPPAGEENMLSVGYVAPPQPPMEGAVIVFENIDLHIESVNGNAEVKGTNGFLLLKNNVFVGKGGKVDWASAGVNTPDLIEAELKEYNFPITSTRIYSEGAVLNYPAKIDKPVDGIFEFKSVKHKTPDLIAYPRFKSYASNVHVKGLGENIEYYGGISLAGKRVFSSSIDEGSSMIKIKKGEDVIIKSSAAKFELGDSLITSTGGNLVIYMNEGRDSIIHPGVAIKYNKNIPKIRAVKSQGYKYAPFIDSYHKLDISVDGIEWNINESQIDLSIFNAKSQIQAVFESEKYYQANKYASMQGMYRFHPLQMLIGYVGRHKEITDSTYSAQDIAKESKLDIASVRGAMVHLMKLGFIDYNVRSGQIKLRPKATHYVMARRDKADYDNVILYSLSPGAPNASLNLETNDLDVRGVEKVFLSDSLRVFILPDSNHVRFLKNRDFAFNGKINTENFQFVGKDFKFSYDSFLVRLRDIQEIKVAITEKKDKGQAGGKSRVLGNELKYSSGTLFINKPDNKSSRKKFPEYPIFDASTGATVFFTKAHINGGAYDTTIQFKIPPFKVDSLSSDDPHAIGFDGEFKSGGIFPEFKEKLVVMPDYSLGFVHKVPPEGYQLYENKGKFYNKITLDNLGIRGDGEIRYLTTTAWSKDFVFYKDSVITVGTKVQTLAGKHPETKTPDVTFPDMHISEYSMKWQPYKDSMVLADLKSPFELYKSTATLEGKAIITAGGMLGQGSLLTRGSESQSKNFTFKQTEYTGRNAIFKILTEDPTKPALLCNDVKIEFFLDERMAYFSPEVEGVASNVFPYLQYKSSLNRGIWDLDKKKISMKMEEGGDLSKSYFYSTHPQQDSLVFNAKEGIYDMESQVLNINGVPYIKVADGKIFPDSNFVVIHENAVMQTLKNAKIVIDTINEYHHLYDGTIDIRGRKRFDGEATYQYVNLGTDTLSIKFQDFRLQESLKKKGRASTVATGVVIEDDSLSIDDGVLYKGKVTMYADNKILFFDGYVQLVLKGALHYSQWMKYVNNGERNEVVIDVTDPKADNGTPLYTGLHFCPTDSAKLYTTFISQKKITTDHDIFTARGLLNKDAASALYTIAPQEKTEKKTKVGNVYVYNDNTNQIQFSGKFNFTQADDNFTVESAGNGDGDLNTGMYNFNVLQAFTCKGGSAAFVPLGQSLKMMTSSMVSDTVVPDPREYERWSKKQESMPYKLAEIMGDKDYEAYKAKSALTYVPLPEASSAFAKAIVLSDVDFKWNHEFSAWYSVGKIKVSNVLKEDINKSVNGYVEIRKTFKGDIVNIYLEPTASSWYYISYENNRLAVLTHDDVVNGAMRKKSKGEQGSRDKFFYVVAEPMEKEQFKRSFEENYLGKTEEEVTFEQHEQDVIEVPDAELEKREEEPVNNDDGEKKSPYPHEEKLEYERKEGKTIEEPELNREKKEHTVEEKKQLQQDQQKMKNLFR